ncbi:probable flavin-containing monooxygenase 1 [Impatiens glandulifera]|uniref:probable flavin-containing monooxygenase 1 n=1 Tax=Impatiens glandulifera TaxID=253017 RepID=UPI001FB05770|nr:probable flavin-containing monooxygenase 1 [Impatiens glandulifera]
MEGEGREVGIIGAGISGLLACKYVLSKGYHPVVFEAESSIGGVWLKTFETTKIQTAKSLYQFSDFPWPPPDLPTEQYPTQDQVLHYIQSYAHHFDLESHIRFNTKVVTLTYNQQQQEEQTPSWSHPSSSSKGKGKWNLTLLHHQEPKVFQADFVIVCVGRFGGVPNIPKFPSGRDPNVFQGKVIHSMDYASMDYPDAKQFLRGKKITVVGFQKSALDIAMESAAVNGLENPCTVLYRTKHWNVPDHQPWGVPLANLYLNRFSELMVHKPGEGFLLSILASLLSPLRWASSKFVETYISHKHRLAKFGMIPKHSFLQELSSCLISTVPDGFYDKVEQGSIILQEAPTFHFFQNGILINGETNITTLETDLVILATGFDGVSKLRGLFESRIFQDLLTEPHNSLPLYRECIHPRIPQLAVIGFSESVTNLFTSEIRCRWVAELLDGTFMLPSIQGMEKEIDKWNDYKKLYSGKYYNRSCIGALHIWYNDQLCKDMGWNPRRKKGIIAELFQPYGPMDYTNP